MVAEKRLESWHGKWGKVKCPWAVCPVNQSWGNTDTGHKGMVTRQAGQLLDWEGLACLGRAKPACSPAQRFGPGWACNVQRGRKGEQGEGQQARGQRGFGVAGMSGIYIIGEELWARFGFIRGQGQGGGARQVHQQTS